MTDFLLELRSEEIPARMQGKARDDLARLFAAELDRAGLRAAAIVTFATPRRLALIARDLPTHTPHKLEEIKGPRSSAPAQAIEGFLKKNRLSFSQLTDRNGVLFAHVEHPGRATAAVLADAIPAIIRAFPWPKSMRWGDASLSTDSLRWVRPLHGIVALFGEEIVPVEIAGVVSGAATLGHRFHHPGPITIGSAADYVEKLHACHVIVDGDERARLIRTRAAALAQEAGLELVEDEGLVAENAGLTEWPVPLLGRFDEAFLAVPPEVIQLTARVNQKYFVCRVPLPLAGGARGGDVDSEANKPSPDPSRKREGGLANAFICTANIDAADGGVRIVEGNRKVLAARLSDARFFYEQDLRVPLEEQAKKLDRIVFHEKLGTVADKVDRVAKLARWLVEEGVVTDSPSREREGLGEGMSPTPVGGTNPLSDPVNHAPGMVQERPGGVPAGSLPPASGRGDLANLAERAARLCKADLVTGMVAEFPELQGVMGGYYARAQGEPDAVADAIRDHYKPVGQGDDVPTAPVTVAVSLADKLDTMFSFFSINEKPSGSRDPFALRRSALGVLAICQQSRIRLPLAQAIIFISRAIVGPALIRGAQAKMQRDIQGLVAIAPGALPADPSQVARVYADDPELLSKIDQAAEHMFEVIPFFADRLKVQQREAGVRHDLIDAVFALGGEDDLVRLLARVRALQQFIGTPDGANLLTGYRRAANILKKERWTDAVPLPLAGGARGGDVDTVANPTSPPSDPVNHAPGMVQERPGGVPAGSLPPASGRGDQVATPGIKGEGKTLSYTPEIAESALHAALDSAEPAAADAVAREDFAAAMTALASLRAPIDQFFEAVTVNDPNAGKRAARLQLLARVRDAVHTVADFSKIEG